jgi:hypothetical protein
MTEKAFDGSSVQRVDVGADGTHALLVKVLGGGAGAASAGASGGVIPGVDTAGTKWVMVINSSVTPPSITYINQSTGATGTPVGEFIPDTDQADWEDAGYILSASGQLTSETQKRGSETRTRTWTYSTDASGNVTATAGAWA